MNVGSIEAIVQPARSLFFFPFFEAKIIRLILSNILQLPSLS